MSRTLRVYGFITVAGLVLGLLVVRPAPEIRAATINPAGPLDELTWLVGCWRFDSPRGNVTLERWTLLPGDTLRGSSVTRRGDTTVDSEQMHIVVRGDTVIFIAEPLRQARAEFRATSLSRTAVVFENEAHDFPQRIMYRPSGDSLYARVDGVVDGARRAIDFPMGRTECTRE